MDHTTVLINDNEFFISGDKRLSKKRQNEDGFISVDNEIIAISLGNASSNLSTKYDDCSLDVYAELTSGDIIPANILFDNLDTIYDVVYGETFRRDDRLWLSVKGLYLKKHGASDTEIIGEEAFQELIKEESTTTAVTASTLVVGNVYQGPYGRDYVYLGKYWTKYSTKRSTKMGFCHLFCNLGRKKVIALDSSRIKLDISSTGKPANMKYTQEIIDLYKGPVESIVRELTDEQDPGKYGTWAYELFTDEKEFFGLPKTKDEYYSLMDFDVDRYAFRSHAEDKKLSKIEAILASASWMKRTEEK